MPKSIRWLKSDAKMFGPGEHRRSPVATYHAFLDKPSCPLSERLCMTPEGTSPPAVHIIERREFCASCIRRSLETFR